jgi:hypothetical protein
MQFDALSGRWQGRYWHDWGVAPGGVPFQLILREAVIGRHQFVGTVRDDPGNGMPGEGEIDGILIDGQISFVKRMPVTYRHLYDQNTGQAGPLIEGEGAHLSIHYVGDWFPLHQEFRGTWFISLEETN